MKPPPDPFGPNACALEGAGAPKLNSAADEFEVDGAADAEAKVEPPVWKENPEPFSWSEAEPA